MQVLKSGTRQARMNWLSTTWGDAAPDKADQMLRSYFEGLLPGLSSCGSGLSCRSLGRHQCNITQDTIVIGSDGACRRAYNGSCMGQICEPGSRHLASEPPRAKLCFQGTSQ